MLLDRLPLRYRLIAAPLLGLALVVLISAGLVAEAQRQSELGARIAARDLVRLDRYTVLLVDLSEQHTSIFDLLRDTGAAIDEETLYERSKRILDRVRAAAAELARHARKDAEDAGGPESAGLDKELIEHALAYRNAAVSAVELSTVDVASAAKNLAVANQRYVAMNRTFTRFLEARRHELNDEIARSAEQSRRQVALIAGGGFAAAVLLLAFSVALSRLLTRSLESHLRALTALGEEAGTPVDRRSRANEIGRIGAAIERFRDLHLRLKESERELERRVAERTRELSDANDALRIYAEVVRSTGEAVAIARPDGAIIDVNAAFEQITGFSRDEVIGTRLFRGASPLGTEGAPRDFWGPVREAGGWNGELQDRRKNGEVFPWWVTINSVRDAGGEVVRVVAVARDVSELKRSERQLQKLAFYDPLTGLANRALLDDRLRMALTSARRSRKLLAVIYVDLDRFKYVNDTLGHPAGDQLLIEIGRRLSEPLRASDTVARMGGDEFTLLLTDLRTESDAAAVAERVIDAVAKPVQLGGETVFVGASLGISFYPRDGDDADTLRKHADVALYEAKEAGRGQYRVFAAQMLAKAGERVSLAGQIETALHNGEFTLYYQPVIDMRSGGVEAVEALIRWRRPGGQMLLPATFIPHAEETGFIKRIDAWVLESACREVTGWTQAQERPLRLCVNLSPITLQQPDVAKQIRTILARTGFDPRRLTLELTETAAIANRRVVGFALKEIAALGVKISLDDFGTGYSSLNHLAGFPIDCIKLDQSFVHRIGKDETSEQIIRSLVQLAENLGLRVIAEGVEDERQQAFLRQNGCDMAQGFRFVRPAPAEEIRRMIAAKAVAPAGTGG